ncbi:hypothetical protein ANANG_G00271960 [Anguilla anguilla]|uniref:Uncharacterized protein n=1 Tax=Anguilla anguilla TaxID=7936 RepID=A0A9D3RK52_ANGAN|nr:hypothetical protein ANANG_G00271960 [Anguilla anguilla]
MRVSLLSGSAMSLCFSSPSTLPISAHSKAWPDRICADCAAKGRAPSYAKMIIGPYTPARHLHSVTERHLVHGGGSVLGTAVRTADQPIFRCMKRHRFRCTWALLTLFSYCYKSQIHGLRVNRAYNTLDLYLS